MIGNILDNTTEFNIIKYTFGEIFSSGGGSLYKNPSDQSVGRCDGLVPSRDTSLRNSNLIDVFSLSFDQ